MEEELEEEEEEEENLIMHYANSGMPRTASYLKNVRDKFSLKQQYPSE